MVPDELRAAVVGVPAPCAVVDLAALRANAADVLRRATGTPVRLATKSVRVRRVVDEALALGFHGLMAYHPREAVWLAAHGYDDVLLAYPTADRAALTDLVADPLARAAVTVMVDHPDHMRLLRAAGAGTAQPVRVCLDVDASLRLGPLRAGVRRSPVRTPAQARAAATRIARTPGLVLRGVMVYDAQVAGVPDTSAAVRAMKRVSLAELARRRAAVVAAVREVAEVDLVNVGGTGSLHALAGAAEVTEVTAGSGLYGPTLFDGYRDFRPRPALYLLTEVVRRGPGYATVYSGGYVASGPPGPARVPTPAHPSGLRLTGTEGAGEVQTPLVGPGAAGLRIGDQVWFRPAKAGEQLERVDTVHLVDAGRLVASVPTYRGEGMTFG